MPDDDTVPDGTGDEGRPAGPSPDAESSKVDDESDESFPASDPPANY